MQKWAAFTGNHLLPVWTPRNRHKFICLFLCSGQVSSLWQQKGKTLYIGSHLSHSPPIWGKVELQTQLKPTAVMSVNLCSVQRPGIFLERKEAIGAAVTSSYSTNNALVLGNDTCLLDLLLFCKFGKLKKGEIEYSATLLILKKKIKIKDSQQMEFPSSGNHCFKLNH